LLSIRKIALFDDEQEEILFDWHTDLSTEYNNFLENAVKSPKTPIIPMLMFVVPGYFYYKTLQVYGGNNYPNNKEEDHHQ
jgi:hypothetical protein